MKRLDKYDGVEIFERENEIPLYKTNTTKLSGPELEIKEEIKDFAITNISLDPTKIPDLKERRAIFTDEVKKVFGRYFKKNYALPPETEKMIVEEIVKDMVGYGMIDPLIYDDNLEEIMVVGREQPVFVYHKTHGTCETNIQFNSESEIMAIGQKLGRDVQRRIDLNQPILDARLSDGSRVNVTIPPLSLDGVSITIRKFRKNPVSIIDMINFGTISSELAAFFWICVEGLGMRPCNTIIAGGTACGKTSLLDAMLIFVPRHDRVISIEDTAELHLRHRNRIRLETRPPNVEGRGEIGMDDLLKNALRMRPDRILVGEVRGKEAQTLFMAMNTGHDGCMGTLHANSAHDVVNRLTNAPMNVPLSMIPALDLVVMEEKYFTKKMGVIRRVSEVAEITVGESGDMQINSLYKWSPTEDTIKSTGIPSRTQFRLEEVASMMGTTFKDELEKRKIFLEGLVAEGVNTFHQVYDRLTEYYVEQLL